ncbi:MAG: DNA recombination protein RmuC [Chloroflexi bacterium]|nr:DNA recombination protein RmuC [Chloroflexota bacterium]MBM3173660.1 DNA recombination protein RmuC [Chloroflexota bacterium]
MNTSWLIATLATIVVILLAAVVALFWRQRHPKPGVDIGQALSNVQQEINNLRQQMNTGLGSVGTIASGMLSTQAATSERLGKLEKATERLIEVGQDISSLQDILQPPKLRGILSETLLESLLSSYLPRESFKMPYQFPNGVLVDAVIFLPAGTVPIDAKFPLDNFRKMLDATEDKDRQQYGKDFARDVTKHINDICGKYILPDYGTLDFALSYIPAENVYYEIIIKDEGSQRIADYALSKRVIPVSPNTFYAHLQAIAIGLKGLRVEKFAREILANLSHLKGEFDRFQEDYRLVGTHIHHAAQKYGEAERKLTRFSDKLATLEAPREEITLLEQIEPRRLPSDGTE